MADPVSWLVVEPGWAVVARDGTEVGKVEEILGDADEDIFNGLSLSNSVVGKPKYVPAERVTGIVEGEIRLDLPAESIEHLDEHEQQPPSSQLRA